MNWAKKAIIAKLESTYGTDSSPAGSTDDVLFIASDVSITPISAQAIPREVVRDSGEFGAYTEYLAGKHVMIEFAVEMAGGGAADTPPPYAPLLQACALAETVTVLTDVDYDPVSDPASMDSVSLYLNIDGKQHKMLGTRGSVSWAWSINQRPMLRFRFLGLFVAVADATFPTMDYSAFQKPLLVNDVNTPTLSLHGAAVNCAGLTIDMGNQVEYRELVNSTSIEIVGRQTTGQITIEDALVATKDWHGIVTAETLGALQIIHGTAAGNICQFDASKVQLKNPRPSGSQNRQMLTLDLVLTPTDGDDEFTFKTK